MAVISGGWSTMPDLLLGSFTLISGIVAVILNPVVFLSIKGSDENPTLFTYKILALDDFMTALFGAFPAVYYVLQTEVPPTSFEVLDGYASSNLSPWHWVHAIMFHILALNPIYICNVINLIKLMAVVFPLRKLTINQVRVIVAVMLVANVVLSCFPFFVNSDTVYWDWSLKLCTTANYFNLEGVTSGLVIQGVPTVMQLSGLVYIIVVLTYLVKRPVSDSAARRAKSRSAMKKLVLINIGNFLYVSSSLLFVYYLQHQREATLTATKQFNLWIFNFLPFLAYILLACITSAYNPAIYIFYSPEILEVFKLNRT